MKKIVYIIDTSVILSGKPLNIMEGELITSTAIESEISPGGKDYRNFQLLQEKGLRIQSPTKNALEFITQQAKLTGDIGRLSLADRELLALAQDINGDTTREALILTDDYSIQNLARFLKIRYSSFSQKGISKKLKWYYRCPGCGKHFKDAMEICPICGTKTKMSVLYEKDSK